MAKYVLVALNGPTPEGSSEELEAWYKEVHIPDLLSVEGIKKARRFETVRGHVPGGELWPNVAIYEIETDNLAKVSEGMKTQCRPFHPFSTAPDRRTFSPSRRSRRVDRERCDRLRRHARRRDRLRFGDGLGNGTSAARAGGGGARA